MASVSSHGTGKHGCFHALSWGHRDLCTVFGTVSQLTFFFFETGPHMQFTLFLSSEH